MSNHTVTRIQDLVSGKEPLKYATGAEVAKDVVIDEDAITADTYGRKLVAKGDLLLEITATGLYGPYDHTASDGRQSLSIGNAVVAAQDVDVQLGDRAIGGYYHNCVFDLSELDLGNMATTGAHSTYINALRTAFPTCVWDD